MHPILDNRARLGAYMLTWLPLAALVATANLLSHENAPSAIALGVISVGTAAILFLSSFFICRSIPLKEISSSQHLSTWAGAALATSALWVLAFWSLLRVISSLPVFASLRFPLGLAFFSRYLAIGIIGYLLSVVLHYLLISMKERQEAEKRTQELQILAREAELKALRAQLNPHFLFNSLNSISALTTTDPKKARSMCVLLSDFLRKSLRLGEKQSVKLAEELELIKHYLTIEQIRFGRRLEVQIDIEPFTENADLPTLLLQPLVENAIKHGISQVLEGGTLKIRTLRNLDFVEVRIENPMDAGHETLPGTNPGLGMGQRQVRERLRNRYENRCYFETSAKEGRYEVVLGFPNQSEAIE